MFDGSNVLVDLRIKDLPPFTLVLSCDDAREATIGMVSLAGFFLERGGMIVMLREVIIGISNETVCGNG